MIREALVAHLRSLEDGMSVEGISNLEALPAVGGALVLLMGPPSNVGSPEALRRLQQRFPTHGFVVAPAESSSLQVYAYLEAGAKGVIPQRLGCRALISALRLIQAGERFIPSEMVGTDVVSEVPGSLTAKERAVVELLKEGLSNKVIALRLSISEVTVKTHLGSVYRKLGVGGRMEAIRMLLSKE